MPPPVALAQVRELVASAYAAHLARRAADFGVTIEGAVAVDMTSVKARKDAVSFKARTGVETWLKGVDRCTVYEGHARFQSAREVSVGDERLTAERTFIHVGGRALLPDMPGVDRVDYLINTSILDQETLPRHVVIVGGSYVGLEFAQMYRRFGSEVTIVEKGPRLIQREDEDVSVAGEDILKCEGIAVRLDTECIRSPSAAIDVVGAWRPASYSRTFVLMLDKPEKTRCWQH
jgi:pyruvate/2-oxoglutarate dehydrogenase complex dihydrolipoamide dehydrogenase (E3) component